MPLIPNKRPVSVAIRGAHKALKQTVKEINQAAADLARKGKYERAEALIFKARELLRFREELVALEKNWKQVGKQGSGINQASAEMLLTAWQYYAPIARSLITIGGRASLNDLEREFFRQMGGQLRAGDRSRLSNGRERWQVMIRRARKHMTKEGWLAGGGTKLWEITASGRKLAENKAGTAGI